MRRSFTKTIGLIATSALLLSITACTTSSNFKPTHKARTSICLIKAKATVPGSANRQLAASMVEAQVVFGVRARVVEISSSESVSNRLLKALQSGCVLMVSAQREYLQQLAIFARGHSRMLVLFVGGEIAQVDQPSNFRWISDELSSAAKLAGFFMAQQGRPIRILLQAEYQNSSSLVSAVREGIAAFRQSQSGASSVTVARFETREQLVGNLQGLVQPSTVLLLASPTYWSEVKNYPDLDFLGADLQFGQSSKALPSNVLGSIERGLGNPLLKAVSALLARDFSNSPPIRRSRPLKDGLAEFRLAAGFTAELENYQGQLEATE